MTTRWYLQKRGDSEVTEEKKRFVPDPGKEKGPLLVRKAPELQSRHRPIA